MFDQFPDVLSRAKAGDPDALAVLYRGINPGLERYLRGRAPEAAEDLATDTWIAVSESLGRFSGDEADFRSWVFTIARNRAIDAHRRSERAPSMSPLAVPEDDEGGDPGAATDAAEDAALDALATEAVLGLVRRLPPDQADVIMLRVVAGLDTDRVAEVLGKKPGTVRVLQHRGLRNLERLLRDPSSPKGDRP